MEKIAKLPIRRMKIDDIVIDTYNPRNPISLEDKEAIRANINNPKIGFIEPLVVNINEKRKNILISGHVRIQILKEEGIKEVDVSVVDLDEREEKKLNLELNKRRADWDLEKLKLLGPDLLLEAGWQPDQIQAIMESDFSALDEKLNEKAEEFTGDFIEIKFKVPKEDAEWVKELCSQFNYDLVNILRKIE